MTISIDARSARAPWRQIKAGLQQRILEGALEAGRPMPQLLDLAVGLRCNPAEVERALRALLAEGWVEKWPCGVLVVSSRGATRRPAALEAGLVRLIDRLLGQAEALGLGEARLARWIAERRETWRARLKQRA